MQNDVNVSGLRILHNLNTTKRKTTMEILDKLVHMNLLKKHRSKGNEESHYELYTIAELQKRNKSIYRRDHKIYFTEALASLILTKIGEQ